MVIKYLKILLILLLVASCRPKKVFIETHTVDTVKVKEVLKVTEPTLNSLVVEEPCDSLGNLNPISYIISTPKTTLNVKSTPENTLIISEETDEIVETTKETEKIHSETSNKKIIIEKPPKWAWYSLIFNILLLIYIFRKFIPVINKIL